VRVRRSSRHPSELCSPRLDLRRAKGHFFDPRDPFLQHPSPRATPSSTSPSQRRNQDPLIWECFSEPLRFVCVRMVPPKTSKPTTAVPYCIPRIHWPVLSARGIFSSSFYENELRVGRLLNIYSPSLRGTMNSFRHSCFGSYTF